MGIGLSLEWVRNGQAGARAPLVSCLPIARHSLPHWRLGNSETEGREPIYCMLVRFRLANGEASQAEMLVGICEPSHERDAP